MSVSVRHLSLHGLPAVQFTLTQFDVDRSHPRPEHLAMLDRCIERLPVRSATITADLSTQLAAARAAALRHHLIFTRKVNQVVVTEGIAGETGARVVFTLDRNRSVIRFGDGVTGATPPSGGQNVTGGYRSGGGAAGNPVIRRRPPW